MEECINGGWKIKGVRSRNTGALYADAVVCTLNAWANSLLATVDQQGISPQLELAHN